MLLAGFWNSCTTQDKHCREAILGSQKGDTGFQTRGSHGKKNKGKANVRPRGCSMYLMMAHGSQNLRNHLALENAPLRKDGSHWVFRPRNFRCYIFQHFQNEERYSKNVLTHLCLAPWLWCSKVKQLHHVVSDHPE